MACIIQEEKNCTKFYVREGNCLQIRLYSFTQSLRESIGTRHDKCRQFIRVLGYTLVYVLEYYVLKWALSYPAIRHVLENNCPRRSSILIYCRNYFKYIFQNIPSFSSVFLLLFFIFDASSSTPDEEVLFKRCPYTAVNFPRHRFQSGSSSS